MKGLLFAPCTCPQPWTFSPFAPVNLCSCLFLFSTGCWAPPRGPWGRHRQGDLGRLFLAAWGWEPFSPPALASPRFAYICPSVPSSSCSAVPFLLGVWSFLVGLSLSSSFCRVVSSGSYLFFLRNCLSRACLPGPCAESPQVGLHSLFTVRSPNSGPQCSDSHHCGVCGLPGAHGHPGPGAHPLPSPPCVRDRRAPRGLWRPQGS